MIKASALYIVIVIALVIALICSALIMAASLYKTHYLVRERYSHLHHNLESAINILTYGQDSALNLNKTFSLFEAGEDSVRIRSFPWGLYDVHIGEAFKNRDTVFSVFSTGYPIDSIRKVAIYLADEDRPLAVSGKTKIQGNAYIPQAGIRPVYIDNETYSGNEKIISGTQKKSDRNLPPLNMKRLNILERLFNNRDNEEVLQLSADTIQRSFRDSLLFIRLNKANSWLTKKSFTGNIILYSEDKVTIDSSVSLKNVLVIAKCIIIKSGFQGKCQLFATDSISIGKNCLFEYPSCFGTLRFGQKKISYPQQINIGENSIINGIIFTYEKKNSEIPSIINLEKNTKIKGQVYAQNILQNQLHVDITGSTFATRFMYLHGFNRFENYLINISINADALSKNYLTSNLLPASGHQKKILQWLELKY